MLLSAAQGDKPVVTANIVKEEFEIYLPAKDSFYSCFENLPISFLNPYYFTMDTNVQYTNIKGLDVTGVRKYIE
jgi:hypothetical protein